MKKRGNTFIINVSIRPELLEEIDKWAEATNRSRSDFFREAARRYMQALDKGEAV